MIGSRSSLTVCILVLLAACGSQSPAGVAPPPPPTGGWLTLQLTSPRTDDGAVQLAVTGPAIDSVALVNYDGYAVVSTGGADLIVTGQIVTGDLARIHVSDLSQYSLYSASVVAAAARGNYSLQQLDGYRVTLVR